MRRRGKRQIEEFLNGIRVANGEIVSLLNDGKVDLALELLTQCQNIAINVGTIIENAQGEGFVTIKYLEEYCELIFSIYEDINSCEFDISAISVDLEKGLDKVCNSVQNDIEVRREVVFMPYKASMWDSLESIYLKMRDDPTVDAKLVPIPYQPVDENGNTGEFICEADKYDKSLDVIDWTEYNLEDRPDAIYIHNPYDEYNKVTRVHPRFFASNLSKYTDELIYVPYFVLPEIDPNNQIAIDRMKHFCYLPGVFYADKVILQSENMAKIYKTEFRRAALENGIPQEILTEEKLDAKFLGTGSPKFDRVMNLSETEYDIPKEWRDIIYKADGSRKKVVLYNTTVVAMLRDGAKMLDKIEWALDVFYENRDKVALLWRPHPLLRNTIESMEGELLERYDAIVAKYRTDAWGIYDDTPDMDRAIAISDAYYGDGSSVETLYEKTGKPIMIQNVDVRN